MRGPGSPEASHHAIAERCSRRIALDTRPTTASMGRRRCCQMLSALCLGAAAALLVGCSGAPGREWRSSIWRKGRYGPVGDHGNGIRPVERGADRRGGRGGGKERGIGGIGGGPGGGGGGKER